MTRLNGITGNHLSAAMVPLDYETDREILDVALSTVGLAEPPDARLLCDPQHVGPDRGRMLRGVP